jgi:hypothetical protein
MALSTDYRGKALFLLEIWSKDFSGLILRCGRSKVATLSEIARPKSQQEETEKTEKTEGLIL